VGSIDDDCSTGADDDVSVGIGRAGSSDEDGGASLEGGGNEVTSGAELASDDAAASGG
jgi:hypothetical protein